MKITQDIRAQLDGSKPNRSSSTKERQSFDTVIQSQSKQLQEKQHHRLMNNISAQGDRVARSRSFRDLAKYKRLIKDFLDETVTYGLSVKQSRSFDIDGRSRKLMLFRAVDDQLSELTEAVMDHEKRSIDVLRIIGEIKGLLINLYT
ncbi:YaaR family protein [Halobacillus sp. Marseille-Q1614]|uniref:YaaR family protein n=1 Tax=Halobacillus sp. Marseille-Q1614 TaxID=2709134 RepID=UPI00156EB098|nr:YaaR family protein [Halobacillus sp. Marseille-Q1614]